MLTETLNFPISAVVDAARSASGVAALRRLLPKTMKASLGSPNHSFALVADSMHHTGTPRSVHAFRSSWLHSPESLDALFQVEASQPAAGAWMCEPHGQNSWRRHLPLVSLVVFFAAPLITSFAWVLIGSEG